MCFSSYEVVPAHEAAWAGRDEDRTDVGVWVATCVLVSAGSQPSVLRRMGDHHEGEAARFPLIVLTLTLREVRE